MATRSGLAETRRNSIVPQSGQKARVIWLPLSAALT